MILPALLVLALTAAGARDGWEVIQRGNDVQVWTRNEPGKAIKSLRGVGYVDAPLAQVALVILDDDHATDWVDSLAEARVVRMLGPLEYVEYNHAKLPLFLHDRDFVTRVDLVLDAPGHAFTIHSRPTEDAALPHRSDRVRGEISSLYKLESVEAGKRTRLTVEVNADPKGSFPAWAVNLFQKQWAAETIHGIRRQAKKSLAAPRGFEQLIATLKGY